MRRAERLATALLAAGIATACGAAPGDDPACVTVSGTVTYASTSVLTVDLGGPAGCNGAATDYDRLTVDDLVLNGGTLAVRLANGYVPGGGEVFDVLDWNNALTGAFGSFDFSRAVLLNGLTWNTSQLHVTGELSVDGTIEADSEAALRQGLAAAPPGATIRFAPALAGQPLLLGTPLVLSKDVTITAADLPGGVILDGGGVSRVIRIEEVVNVSLEGLTITGGVGVNGAGIENLGGNLTITDSTVTDNHASFYGGGIINFGGTTTISHATVAGNSAGLSGGGLYNGNDATSTVTVSNSTFTGNSAANNGGGVYNFLGVVTIVHATFAINDAANQGGGLVNAGGTFQIENTIVAGNTDTFGNPDMSSNVLIAAAGRNLVGDNTGVSASLPAGEFVGTAAAPVDAMLEPPGDYGGPTRTLRPLADSPVIDAALVSASTPITDQRGFARPVDGDSQAGAEPDIGAVEFDPASAAPVEQVPALPAGAAALLAVMLAVRTRHLRPRR